MTSPSLKIFLKKPVFKDFSLSKLSTSLKITEYGIPVISSQILKAIEEERGEKGFGHRFFEKERELNNSIIENRNLSIIVHGENPLDREKFERAWNSVSEFLGITEE